jgi:V/A-type H+-transporting ATPase subunit E
MAEQAPDDAPISRGVDTLIAKLREEGVAAGRAEADRIRAEAEADAKRTVTQAQAKARKHIEAARKEAASFQAAGEEAVKTAMRDAILEMKSGLMQRFGADVARLVSERVRDESVLQEMILELVGRVRKGAKLDKHKKVELILPETAANLEELRKDPKELQEGKATGFVLGLADEMLREGLVFSVSEDVEAGVKVRLVDDSIDIDVTSEAIAAHLLKHLQPRFRAVLEGIVK